MMTFQVLLYHQNSLHVIYTELLLLYLVPWEPKQLYFLCLIMSNLVLQVTINITKVEQLSIFRHYSILSIPICLFTYNNIYSIINI